MKPYGLETPTMRITLGAGSSQTVLEIGATEGEQQPYARDRSRPMVFMLDTTLAEDLTKPFDAYRNKDLFESRPFTTDRVRLTRATGGSTQTWDFAKTSGPEGDTWQVTPEGGTAAAVDPEKASELLNKLSALRVASFATNQRRTGLDAPVLTVGVSYDGGKFERVRIGKTGSTHYGSRQGEGATGEVDATSVESVLQALDDALIPPPAPPPTPAPVPDAPKQ